ncbi:MAG: elongation factor G, partial [bacterium]
IDLLSMKLVTYERGGSGSHSKDDIPADLQGKANGLREKLMESAAENDDELLEKYFDAGELSTDEIKKGLKAGIASGGIYPVLCGVATENVGTHQLLDFISDYAPSPAGGYDGMDPETGEEVKRKAGADEAAAALVFKTESEPHVGEFSFFRVYSGSIKTGDDVYNINRKSTERIGAIFSINGHNRNDLGSVVAGDIAAVVKLKSTHTGDTLCERRSPIQLAPINYPHPRIRAAIETKSKGDEERISTGLATLHEEDPTFVAGYDPELRQTIIQGQGELHLDIVVKRLKDKFSVDVDLVEPKIPYRETIKGTADVQYKHKKQSGGRGQYGEVYIKLARRERGEDYEFVNSIVGGAIPSKYIPAVDKGIRETMQEGPLAGCLVVDLTAELYDGSYHAVDSSDMAFKIAGSMAFKRGFMEAKPHLLEPIYDVEVQIPEDYMGDVMGDLSSRRGKIMGVDSEGHFQLIKVKVPLAELYRYSTSLRSMTQGRGLHRLKFSHYEEVPSDVAEKVIKAAREEKEAEK